MSIILTLIVKSPAVLKVCQGFNVVDVSPSPKFHVADAILAPASKVNNAESLVHSVLSFTTKLVSGIIGFT